MIKEKKDKTHKKDKRDKKAKGDAGSSTNTNDATTSTFSLFGGKSDAQLDDVFSKGVSLNPTNLTSTELIYSLLSLLRQPNPWPAPPESSL